MHKIFLTCLASLIVVLNASAQDQTTYQSAEQIQREVTFLLLDKNINEVAKELDNETPSTINALLRRLVIYSRAGQNARVRKSLEQLASLPDWQCRAGYDVRTLIRKADESLDAQRFYYERVCPDDSDGADEFINVWSRNGNTKEIDAWLAERSSRDDAWLNLRVHLRAKLGTAGELLDTLAADIRANPSDWERLNRYLLANHYAGNIQDVSWLAESFAVRTAADYFQLGEVLELSSPQSAARLLQKSLELPFTEADAKFVNDRINRYRSDGQTRKVNEEKQLRFWTKFNLAEAYRRLNQPLAAQPLVEELVVLKRADDILLQDVHKLAGAVQSESGQRVVETKILGDETARRSTSEYWLERAKYYAGRDEYELQRDSYREALVALAARPEDTNALRERLQVVRSFAFFLGHDHAEQEDKAELQKLLTRELNSVPPETDYAFQIARLITQSELDADELRNSLLAKRPAFLTRLLDARREWTNEEELFIENVVHQEEVAADLKQTIWSSLESLVREPGSTRAYFLANAMRDSNEWQRALPLLRGYIQHALPTNWEGYKPDAIASLFTAYCRTKQWRTAERYLMANKESFWHGLANRLAEVAIVAAQQNAIDDSMRLWRMSTNLDGRNFDNLRELAQTKARPQLVAMYLQMKKDDPLSTIPDLALRILQ